MPKPNICVEVSKKAMTQNFNVCVSRGRNNKK